MNVSKVDKHITLVQELLNLWNRNNERIKAPVLRVLLNFYSYDQISKKVDRSVEYLKGLSGMYRNYYYINVTLEKIDVIKASSFILDYSINLGNSTKIKRKH